MNRTNLKNTPSQQLKSLMLLALLVIGTSADCYMQNPPGSNDRTRERNDNRQNANRLFDSQNNAAGGYPWPGDATLDSEDCMEVYAGSKLELQWTIQHSCGPNSNALCSFIIQYGDDLSMPSLRDPMPSGNVVDTSDNNNPDADERYFMRQFDSAQQNAAGTNTIPVPNEINKGPNFNSATLNSNEASQNTFYAGGSVGDHEGQEFALHEDYAYYRDQCYNTERNRGLYTADQNLNGDRAIYTRQNPDGTRSGLECPEERDYYPWWNPSPWKDIAVFTSDISWCDYYRTHSQNVAERWICVGGNAELAPVTESSCSESQGTWTRVAPYSESEDIEAPICDFHPSSRDNHLGNAALVDEDGNVVPGSPETASFIWSVPEALSGRKIVLRYRYNMSSLNYDSMNAFASDYQETLESQFVDSRFNCDKDDDSEYCTGKLTLDNFILKNRPYVNAFEDSSLPKLSLAINTNQVGRTFQDRSYCIRVVEKPEDSDCDEIYNLNVRGRRGNIVQTYPAVEYDFVPQTLEMTENDCAHVQFMGTDFNANKNPNDGEGWRYSSRTNMVQAVSNTRDFPKVSHEMWQNPESAAELAFVGQDLSVCKEYENGDNNEDNANDNCGKLNAAPAHFNGGLQKFTEGTHTYMSTRNNNFSNRSQKGVLVVKKASPFSSIGSTGGIILLSVGVIAGVALLVAGVFVYRKRSAGSGFNVSLFNKNESPANTANFF